jgi:Uma2 family endonuclease
MIEAGVLTEDDRVELLEGLIVTKMPHKPPHDTSVSVLLRRLWTKLPDEWIVHVQSAVTLATSEPEPDLAVVRGPEERYRAAHPTPKDIAMLVEVADTTLLHDQNVKGRLYAAARIQIYWIVNLVESTVDVYANPRGGKAPGYRQVQEYGIEASVPLVIAGKELGVIAVGGLVS